MNAEGMALDNNNDLYKLSTGQEISSMIRYSSPIEEYSAAFEDRDSIFLNYYKLLDGDIEKHTYTRGEFWDAANSAALYLNSLGLKKGDRIVHAFSANSLYDLIFRLAAVLTGCVPVTINWQADNNESIIYKTEVTDAKLIIYDNEFAGRIEEIKTHLDSILFFQAKKIDDFPEKSRAPYPALSYDDERMIVFTSGTTGKPKGVSLSHRSYFANRLTFESYFGLSRDSMLDLLLVNPLHHSNSSALSDWGMRRKGAIINLVQRYSTSYWKILVDIARNKRDLLVAPVVSRHFDFLQGLSTDSKLPVDEADLKEALRQTDILIGSAPVGPATIERILKFCTRLPHVRFGSTETCLQVMAAPVSLSEDELMEAFKAGWSHRYDDRDIVGYYIGRAHHPFTRIKIVKATDPDNDNFMVPCEIGEPGYIITQGPNIMSRYIGDDEATKSVFIKGWYTGLKDVVFALKNKNDGHLDYYWTSRESELLIRGGANYAYDQIAAELKKFTEDQFNIETDDFHLAVVGLRLESEHEDCCCVTIELSEGTTDINTQLERDFIEKARQKVSKGARPDYIRFALIPRNFKGAVLYPQLKKDFKDWIKHNL